MYILGDKQVIHGSADLTHRRDEGIGKDVFVHPGVVHLFRPAVSNGMKEEKAIVFKTSVHDLHVSPVI
jgi:hypothetical protein